VSEEFERAGRRKRPARVVVPAAMLVIVVAVAFFVLQRRDNGGSGVPPGEGGTCYVDVDKEARITLDANGNVRGHERTIPIRIPPGDTRRYGVKWIVNNRDGASRREIHIGNMRRGSKASGREDIFERGSDRAVIAARSEQHFYSCLLSSVPEANFFYDILVDGQLKIDPEIAIIRR
jgi:hypothetical protein